MFAMIQTEFSIYDRVEVVFQSSTAVDISYRKRQPHSSKWSTQYERIPQKHIITFRSYVD